MLKTSIVNLILRGLTLVSKFALLLFIARFLSPEELGVWGLVNATLAISLYILGLDFYVFNTREILAIEEPERVPLIRDQIVFHGLVYIAVLPLLLIVFFTNLISWQYIGWFYALLVLEHLSQESARLLATLSKSTMANLAAFFRSGAWVYVVVSLMYNQDDLRQLPFIWSGWIVGVLSSMFLTVYALRNMPWKDSIKIPIDWAWMLRGLKTSLPFFCATLSFIGVQYADRYFIQHFWGEAMVGVYTFYASISNVIHVFVFTGVIMILYPRIVSSYQKGQFVEYRALMKKMGTGIIGGAVVLSILAALLIEPVLSLVGKQVFVDYLDVFWIMLVAVMLLCVSYIPHYSLFVRNRDKAIVVSSLAAVVIGLLANAALVPEYGLKGAAISSVCAMTTILVVKSYLAFVRTDD